MALNPLPWWADPTNARNRWQADYSRTYNPQGITDPNDPNYSYQTWLQQNFDTRQFQPTSTNVQTRYGGEEFSPTAAPVQSTTQAPPTPPPTTTFPDRPTVVSSNTNNDGTRTEPGEGDVWDGFARRYAPGQRDLLFSNQGPGIVLRDYLNQDGRTNYLNMEGDLARYAAVAPEIYDLLLGGNMDPDVIGDDDIINWMASMFGEQTQEGGSSPTLQMLLNGFMGGINNDESGLYKDVMIDEYGNPTTTQAQIQKINEMIPYLNTFSGNYRYTDRMKKEAARLGQEYASRVANGDAAGQTYGQYLKQHFLR